MLQDQGETALVAPEPEVTEVFLVGPDLVPCEGVAPMECMVVNGRLFYDVINGFTHEPGFYQVIRVRVTTLENPPADAGMYEYTFVDNLVRASADLY